jgi:hypothetical protein
MFSLSAVLVAIPLLCLGYASAVDLSPARLFARASGCSTSGPASCRNSSVVSDSCCFESPGVSSSLVSVPYIPHVDMFTIGSFIADTSTRLSFAVWTSIKAV